MDQTIEYVEKYKKYYETIGGSFEEMLKNDEPYLSWGWINDNCEVGSYYKSHALNRICYDIDIVELIQWKMRHQKPVDQKYRDHLMMIRNFYRLKGTTIQEMREELSLIGKEVYKNLQNKNKEL